MLIKYKSKQSKLSVLITSDKIEIVLGFKVTREAITSTALKSVFDNEKTIARECTNYYTCCCFASILNVA